MQPLIGLIQILVTIFKNHLNIFHLLISLRKMTEEIKFSHWQWFISIASIVVLFVANILYAAKRDI